ncbi:hypothetical protein EV356DRAFT_529022 [Viridothelium virens]|uniref:Store-operated calcium entry-associated regulatory factor n=1 Tax=Viridothelium virens TaxID=1048519 RepID=A0A6A6HKB5_VIRVR|nr:hypothetical protein EV356DRAFT_529022 [Viridothelium virens]
MRYRNIFAKLLLAIFALSTAANAARKPADSVLLSNVKTLTLRAGLKTSHRRVSAVPQLKCVGGNAKGLYDVDVMRCKNQGTDYDDDNVQWTCTAALPAEFKLGSTDVICEGYDSSSDPYVLKGSCGVEYRLILTEQGEEKYGRQKGTSSSYDGSSSNVPATLFWLLFVAVILWMLYSAFIRDNGPRPRGPPRGPRWGGGGGNGGGDDDDPPPPYDYHPPRKPRTNISFDARPAFNNWRPGFWTGAAGGAAAGYLAGRRNGGTNPAAGNGNFRNNDPGVGSSTRPASSSSTSRHESTGFGTSSRR